jgi:adenosylcobinamide-GDP ribazoletransferase
VVHGRPGHAAVNADVLRLCVGTLTVLRVRPPQRVDRRVAGRAMVLAPLVGLVLGLVVVAAVWTLGGGGLPLVSPADPTLPAAAVVVAALALLTRGLHLDGLADAADGLGSGRDVEGALAVMRRGDVGPFGVVTLVLVLLLQVASVERLVQSPAGLGFLVGALVLSRLVLPVLCLTGIPAARPEGLGALVAGSVGRIALAASVGAAVVVLVLVALLTLDAPPWLFGGVALPDPPRPGALHVVAFLVVPLLVTALFARRCLRRFGGVTGDVLGACVEVAFTTALLVAAL